MLLASVSGTSLLFTILNLRELARALKEIKVLRLARSALRKYTAVGLLFFKVFDNGKSV